MVVDLWSEFRTSSPLCQAKVLHMLLQSASVDMLSKYVCSVVRARDFQQSKITGAKSILHPQICCGQMSDFPQAAAAANAHRGCGVRPDREVKSEAEI